MPVEAGDIEPEWMMFKASIVEAAAVSCGHRVLGASRGGNPRTLWWTPVVRETIRLKKESFRDMLSWGTCDAVLGYRWARWAAATAVAEYFGDLLNPTQPPSVIETEDDGCHRRFPWVKSLW